MARMIPPILPVNTPSLGEREIFQRLSSDPTTEAWIVMHSLDTARHIKQIFGEVDFVVIVPNKGVLCLEVKGTTRLRREHGIWYYGNSAPDARGPFKQAAQAMHSVRNFVTGRAPDLKSIVFWSAVAFPLVNFHESSPEWHSWQVIDRRAMAALPIGKLIEQVLDNARAFLAENPRAGWFSPDAGEPDTRQCDALSHLLRAEFELFESPKSRKQRLNKELKRYTAEQMRALDGLEQNARVVFTGPAGTGKTLLALEAARRGSLRGKKVLLLCFNRFLGKSLETQAASMEGVIAGTLHAHMRHVAGMSPNEQDSQFWSETLPGMALEKLLNTEPPPQFDMLVIDEAQDMLCEPYLDFLDFSLRGGLANGRWRIFGDFEKQQIFRDSHQLTLDAFLVERGDHAPQYSLRVNCRNTPRIATSAHWLGQLEPDYSNVLRPDDGVNAEYIYYRSDAQQTELLSSTLQALYDDGFSGDDIVILSPKATARACASRINDPPWSDRLAPFTLELEGQVGYCTIHAFKGLEANAVIITDIEEVASKEAGQLFYVAVTRALHRVIILASTSAEREFKTMLLKGLSGGV